MTKNRIISALWWIILIYGFVTSVILPLMEFCLRVRYGVVGEDLYLRIISLGKWDGIAEPPIKFPYFQNSDVFEETLAFVGGIIFYCRFLVKNRISFLFGIAGMVLWWFSISIAGYYSESSPAQLAVSLAWVALAAFSGLVAGSIFKNRRSNSMPN